MYTHTYINVQAQTHTQFSPFNFCPVEAKDAILFHQEYHMWCVNHLKKIFGFNLRPCVCYLLARLSWLGSALTPSLPAELMQPSGQREWIFGVHEMDCWILDTCSIEVVISLWGRKWFLTILSKDFPSYMALGLFISSGHNKLELFLWISAFTFAALHTA